MKISRRFLRFFSTALLLGSIAGCAYIIPEDVNAPRHNKVLGERRVPERNADKLGERIQPATSPQSMYVPPSTPVVHPRQVRQVPIENREFMLSAAGYPTLGDIPPRPPMTGYDSPQSRLNETKSALERDRTQAAGSAEALARDAAAEPSMLNDLPKADGNPSVSVVPSTSVPPGKPEALAPAPSVTTQTAPVAHSQVTASTTSNGGYVLPPPPGAYPIESAQEISPSVVVPMGKMPTVKPGDFDPLAAADNAPIISAVPTTTIPRPTTSYATNPYSAQSH